jgi:uncharacterized membrane protein YfcA
MTLSNAALLFAAAGLAGVMNSVAGGGSFISFPALIFTHVLPIPANATSTVALWPGAVASAGAYRRRFPKDFRVLAELIVASLVGGTLGALVLLRTPQNTFLHFVPYLFLMATLLLIFGKDISTWLDTTFSASKQPRWLARTASILFQFLIALYGGFFGAGIGIMMLALLTMLKMEDIHAMNALKTLLNAVINGAAVVTFIAAGAVLWPQALVMLVGAVLGGYGGAHYALKLDPQIVRRFVIAVGIAISAYFFLRH